MQIKRIILFTNIFFFTFILQAEAADNIVSTCKTKYWYDAYNQLSEAARIIILHCNYSSPSRIPCSGYLDGQCNRIANFPDTIYFGGYLGWTYDPTKKGKKGTQIFHKETKRTISVELWDDNDPLWQDMPNGRSGIYDDGVDLLLHEGDGSIADGDMGICNGRIYFFDNNDNNICDKDEEVWQDSVQKTSLGILFMYLQSVTLKSYQGIFANYNINNGDYSGLSEIPSLIEWDYENQKYTQESVKLFPERPGDSAYQITVFPEKLEDGTQITDNAIYADDFFDFYINCNSPMPTHVTFLDNLRLFPVHFEEIRTVLNANRSKHFIVSLGRSWRSSEKGVVTVKGFNNDYINTPYKIDFYAEVKRDINSDYKLERFAQVNGAGNPDGISADYDFGPSATVGYLYMVIKWDLPKVNIAAFSEPKQNIPDSNNDNFLNLAVDLNNCFNETGIIFHTPNIDNPQMILPIRKNNYSDGSSIASFDFFYQGLASPFQFYFLDDSINDLQSMFEGEFLLPISRSRLVAGKRLMNRSLNYHLFTDIYLNNDDLNLHVKRLALIRPYGNMVTFKFPWNAEKNKFEKIGIPIGINEERTYRLIYDGEHVPNSPQNYSLQFEDGTSHEFTFDRLDTWYSSPFPDKYIKGFHKGDILLYAGYQFQYFMDYNQTTWKRSYYPTHGFKYNVNFEGDSDGILNKIIYVPKDGNTDNQVTVELIYDSDDPTKIKKLKKTVPLSMAINNKTQYEISVDGDTITYPDGSSSKREQTAPAGQERIVTITKTDPNAGTTVSKYYYNNSDLLTKTEITTNGNTAATEYTYCSSGTVYPNTTKSEHKIKSIKYPDGSWKYFTYNDNGWLEKVYSPYKNIPVKPGISKKFSEYLYSPHEEGDAVDVRKVWEKPKTEITSINGVETSRRYFSYTGNNTIFNRDPDSPNQSTIKQAFKKGAEWSASGNLVKKDFLPYVSPYAFMISKTESPLNVLDVNYSFNTDGEIISDSNDYGYRTNQKTIATVSSLNGTGLREVTTITNPRGIVESRIVKDSTSKEILASVISQTDSFGRITRTDYLDGTFETFEDYCLYGPRKITDRMGNVKNREYYANGNIKSDTSKLAKTEYAYDALGNLVSQKTTPNKGVAGEVIAESWTYDAQSRITSHTDVIGTTTYAYKGPDVTITYPDKTTKIIDKNLDGTTASISGTAVSPISYDYGVDEKKGYWQKTIKGNIWHTTFYNMLGQAYRKENSSGYWTENSYDAKGRLVATLDSSGRSSATVYNSKNEVAKKTINGVVTEFSHKIEKGKNVNTSTLHSSLGDMVSINSTALTGNSSTTTVNGRKTTQQIAYLGEGKTKSTSTGPLNIVSESLGDNISSTSTLKKGEKVLLSSESLNDGHGRTVKATAPRIGTSLFKYRAGTRQVAETVTPDERKTEITYKTNSFNPDTIKTPYQSVLKPVFDAKSNLNGYEGSAYGIFDALSSFNELGQMEKLKTKGAPGEAATSFSYHPASGLLAGKKIGDKQAFNIDYYPDGRISKFSIGSLTKTFKYTAAPQLFPAGLEYDSSANTPNVSISGHNTFGQPAKIATEDICEHSFTYNKDLKILQDNITSAIIKPRETSYQYNEASNSNLLRSQMISNKNKIEYGYDDMCRLETITAEGLDISYAYVPQSAGLIDTLTVKKGDEIIFVRDFNYEKTSNRVTSVANEDGNGVILDSFAYQYVDNANKISSITRRDGSVFKYSYGPRGQLESEIKKKGIFKLNEYAYSADSITNILTAGRIKFGNQPEFKFTPDIFNGLKIKRSGTTIEVSGFADKDAAITVNNERLKRDGEHESFFCIIDAGNDESAVYVPIEIIGALFDPEAVPEIGGDQSGNVAGSDLIQEVAGTVFMPKAVDEPVYDNIKGHLLEDSTKVCTWDFENRLLSVENKIKNPEGKFVRIENTYDHAGRRIKKSVFKKSLHADNWKPVTDHFFYYDGTQLAGHPADFGILTGEIIINQETGGSNELQYLWGLDSNGAYQGLGGIGGLVAVINKTTGDVFLPVMDKKGTVYAYIDTDSGKEVAKFAYTPYGDILESKGEMAGLLSLRYNTKYYDQEVNLYYHETRFYDPVNYKWLSRDPIGESGGLNLYAYCNNDPINGVDYLGTEDIELGGPFWDFVEKSLFGIGDSVAFPEIAMEKGQRKIADVSLKIKLPLVTYGINMRGSQQQHITGLAKDLSKISACVYDIQGAPKGWSRVSDNEIISEFGLNPELFYSDKMGKTGFYAGLYKRNSDNVYVLAFRGTGSITDYDDWIANISQGLGRKNSQYENAMDLALQLKISIETKGFSLFITGHSLGGGLASAASIRSRSLGITFNAAGLHPKTLIRNGSNISEQDLYVKSYIIQGEILNWFQNDVYIINALMPDAAGIPVRVAPYENSFQRSIHFIGRNSNIPFNLYDRTILHLNSAIQGRTR